MLKKCACAHALRVRAPQQKDRKMAANSRLESKVENPKESEANESLLNYTVDREKVTLSLIGAVIILYGRQICYRRVPCF